MNLNTLEVYDRLFDLIEEKEKPNIELERKPDHGLSEAGFEPLF